MPEAKIKINQFSLALLIFAGVLLLCLVTLLPVTQHGDCAASQCHEQLIVSFHNLAIAPANVSLAAVISIVFFVLILSAAVNFYLPYALAFFLAWWRRVAGSFRLFVYLNLLFSQGVLNPKTF